VSSPREQIEEPARRAIEEARDHPGTTALAAAAAGAAAAAAGVGLRRLRDGAGPADSSAYRLLAGEPVGPGMKRIIAARVDEAIDHLRGDLGEDSAERVHEARKDLKKTRSALRLVRDALGDEIHRRENEHYRDAGRSLSGSRDAEAMIESLDALVERFGEGARDRTAGLREQLEAELRDARAGGSTERAMASAAAALAGGRPRIGSLPLQGDGWELIGPGIQRSYRRGRKRLRAVEEEASVANLHELRKRVKDLWYQLRLIRDADEQMVGSLAAHAHDLSDHLGDDHDLALLRGEAVRRSTAFGEPSEQRHLIELIDRRRGELQFAAISLGSRIYAVKPKRFAKRLESRWEAWREREPVAA
jgi:CHAD domain-containing protein